MNELDLFTAALAIADSQARAAYLDEHCRTNPELRRRLDELLQAYRQADQVLPEVPGIDPQLTEIYQGQVQQRMISTVIAGRYKLLEAIGEGGMGTVFVAEQTEPVKRKVAVKLIKAGMDSKQVLARFAAERQALALMDHPNIARVLDAGLTEERRPYFVMEYIKGLPLTKYCDDVRLSIDERLKLFIQICQAVQHAHQKGIIHRDLKPGNILIALYDGKPVPKVIDFGLAKALHQSLTEQTLHTGHEMVLGTPLYMSPEQAELNNLDIDTRTDIYSLGVILYELLTGVTPLEKKRFKEAAWAEVLRIIKEEEPSKPSTKLSSSESLPSVAAQRQMEPKKLSSLMRGDLDWIVMKALEKDRNRRYETANGFAADVLRYLSGDAVTAAPPSAGYRFKKFVKRNKVQVIAASLVLAALVLGMIGTTIGFFQASWAAERERQAKLDAEAKEKLAVAAAEKERIARLEEERERKFAQAIASFVKDDFLALTSVEGQDRFGGAGLDRDTTLLQLLDRAAGKLKERKDLDPRIEAELCWIIGVNYRGAGEATKGVLFLERAVKLRQQVLGPDHPDTLESMNSLAIGYSSAGKLEQALPLHEETLKLRKAKLGPDHPNTLASMIGLAGGYSEAGKLNMALPLNEETLKLCKAKLGPDHFNTLVSMGNLAACYRAAGQLDKALPLYEETLKFYRARFGPDHHYTIACMSGLAGCYSDAGQLNKALPLFEETLKLRKAKLDPDHPDTLRSMNRLACGYQDSGRLDEALPLYEEALKLTKAKLGPDHPDTIASMNNLASGYRAAGQLDKALPLHEETLKLCKAKFGPDHPYTIASMNNLAACYNAAGQLDMALPLFEDTLKLWKAKLGPDHPHTLSCMNNLADCYLSANKLDLALPLLKETLKLRNARLGPNHPSTLQSMHNLARGYQIAGQLDQVLPLFEEAAQGISKLHFQHEHAHLIVPNTIGAYEEAKQFDKADEWRRQWLTHLKATAGADSPAYAGELAGIGLSLLQRKKWTEAEATLRECIAIRKEKEPDAWTTFNTQSMLGEALLGQKKYTEAEPLLLKGYEGMKQREKTIPPQGNTRIPEALDRLIQLYTEINKPDEVKKWQAERAKIEGVR